MLALYTPVKVVGTVACPYLVAVPYQIISFSTLRVDFKLVRTYQDWLVPFGYYCIAPNHSTVCG
ncbi:MAG: hypothetical protein KO464_07915 [Candidatus Methanofastidiosum sp.]|nr:hypothetical protein [Methanofastidiosum sp.]